MGILIDPRGHTSTDETQPKIPKNSSQKPTHTRGQHRATGRFQTDMKQIQAEVETRHVAYLWSAEPDCSGTSAHKPARSYLNDSKCASVELGRASGASSAPLLALVRPRERSKRWPIRARRWPARQGRNGTLPAACPAARTKACIGWFLKFL